MTIAKMIASVTTIAGIAITATACMTDGELAGATETAEAVDTAEASSASTICRLVKHFRYTHNGEGFQWDVTTEIGTGRQFVDEFKPRFRRQYSVSPVWSDCPAPNEIVRLRSGSIVLVGSHNCFYTQTGALREEYHGSDYQRLLIPQIPFVTFNCDP
jgi:hypothetical protein